MQSSDTGEGSFRNLAWQHILVLRETKDWYPERKVHGAGRKEEKKAQTLRLLPSGQVEGKEGWAQCGS